LYLRLENVMQSSLKVNLFTKNSIKKAIFYNHLKFKILRHLMFPSIKTILWLGDDFVFYCNSKLNNYK